MLKKLIIITFSFLLYSNAAKSDELKIKIDKILLGDLIYDGYLKFFSIETLDINSYKFKKYLYEFILIYLYWKDYLIPMSKTIDKPYKLWKLNEQVK